MSCGSSRCGVITNDGHACLVQEQLARGMGREGVREVEALPGCAAMAAEHEDWIVTLLTDLNGTAKRDLLSGLSALKQHLEELDAE